MYIGASFLFLPKTRQAGSSQSGQRKGGFFEIADWKCKVHTVVNLHGIRVLSGHKVKVQVERIDRRREIIRVGIECAGPEIAGVGRLHWLVVQHQTHEAFLFIALVEIGSVGQLIRLAHGDGQILTQTRSIRG